jgi:hypothetical protein
MHNTYSHTAAEDLPARHFAHAPSNENAIGGIDIEVRGLWEARGARRRRAAASLYAVGHVCVDCHLRPDAEVPRRRCDPRRKDVRTLMLTHLRQEL